MSRREEAVWQASEPGRLGGEMASDWQLLAPFPFLWKPAKTFALIHREKRAFKMSVSKYEERFEVSI